MAFLFVYNFPCFSIFCLRPTCPSGSHFHAYDLCAAIRRVAFLANVLSTRSKDLTRHFSFHVFCLFWARIFMLHIMFGKERGVPLLSTFTYLHVADFRHNFRLDQLQLSAKF